MVATLIHFVWQCRGTKYLIEWQVTDHLFIGDVMYDGWRCLVVYLCSLVKG